MASPAQEAAPPERGGRAKLEALIDEYAGLIARAVRRVAGPRADWIGEDVEQRVRLALWHRLEREPDIGQPASYIYRAAVRETLRVLRREKAPGPDGADLGDRAAGTRDDPQHRLEMDDLARAIAAALETLPVDRRRAVKAHLAGFGRAEIVEMYAWSYDRVRNLVTRGMVDLRRELRRRGIHG